MLKRLHERLGRGLLWALTLGVLTLAAWLTASPAGTSPSTKLGFNSWVSTQNIALQRLTGLRVRRMFVYWNLVEPSPGKWNWSTFDTEYTEILRAGLQPEIDLTASPCWSRPSVACDDAEYTGPPDPSYEGDWSQFVKLAAERYRRAVGFEIWSEQNLIWFFYPQIDPARYTRLLGDAYRAIKSVDPATPVAAGGLAATVNGGLAATSYQQYIADMYWDGAGSVMNAIAIHIYPGSRLSNGTTVVDPSEFEQVLNQIRTIQKEYGGKQPIWVTELGESTSSGPGATLAVTPNQQASDLMTMVGEAKADSDVGMVLIHTVQDTPNTPSDPYNAADMGWGAFTAAGTPKPLACDLSAAFGGSLRCS